MRWIVESSLKYRFLVVILAAVMMLYGINQLRTMPVDVLPEFSPTYVEIQTEALGLSANEVEQLITMPMEQDLLNGVAWLDVIRSESVPGLSSILLFFEPGTDLYQARQMVSERLAQAAVGLPHVSKPPTMIQPLSSTSRFMIVGLSSQELPLIELSVLARWVIGPRLMGVPGVANVAIWGQRERQLQVQVDPEQLRSMDVSLQQILETTGNALWVSSLTFLEASTPGTGGFIDTPNQRLGIWHVLPISSPDELAQVPVEGTTMLRLGEVANVIEDHQPLIGDAVVNDEPNLLLLIEKFPNSNTREVTHGVEDALAALQPGLPGVEIDSTIFRPANYIDLVADNLSRTALIGSILVVLVLIFFFFEWRSALISLVAIPVSIVAAGLVLSLMGESINVMVLAGLVIALGIVVDDAIVDVENIVRRIRRHRQEGGEKPLMQVILEASVEMRSALFFATLILLLAVLPVFFVESLTGSLFRPLVVTYSIAVLASMLVALTVTPALCFLLLSKAPLERREPPLASWLQRGYSRMLERLLRRPRWIYATTTILFIASLAILPFLNQDILPSFREPQLMIQLEGMAGMSNPEMNRIVTRTSQELRTLPGVSNVGAHVGRAVFGDQVVGTNSAQLWVSIDPKANYDATVSAIREVVNGYPGLDNQVDTYLHEVLGQALERSSQNIAVRVFGEGLAIRRSQAEKVQQAISQIEGVENPHVDLPVEEPTLEIEVDLEAAQHYGIKPGDVRRAAAALFSSLQVGSLFEDQKVFDVVVWSTPNSRNSLTSMRELLLDTPSGDHVRLEDVADVRISSAPNTIKREGVSPFLDVLFTVQDRDLDAVAADIKSAIQGIEFPLEYHAELVGDYAIQQSAGQRVLIAVIVMVIGVFILLQATFRSWRLAALVFLTIPVALVGGALAVLLVSGGAISFGSVFGFLAVLGITLRNSIALISHYHQLEDHEGESFGPELVLRGSRERLTPILMTTLSLALAILPFILLGGIAGQEMAHPMAIVILGGLVTSTLLNLFLLPPLYLRFGHEREREHELFSNPVAGEA